jgi:uncharacterized protein YndB with AHSA1/START domain
MTNKMNVKIEGAALILERVFDAPREQVFQAFSESDQLKRWWGPRGWALSACTVDFRPNGVWHYCMKCEDKNQGEFYGMESWGKAVYREIVENEKIVYTDYFSDAEGNEADGMPASQITVIFEQDGGKTKLVSRSAFESSEALQSVLDMGVEQGIAETWDRLEEHLHTLQ